MASEVEDWEILSEALVDAGLQRTQQFQGSEGKKPFERVGWLCNVSIWLG